ncbi:VWA domain-containing protein [Pseudomonas sp. BIGb0427]|uniref:vWA domain-containing protein n=1 Tax=unclassified Pseudomonas TaxID=196821 RepID=UPI0018A75C95|nr:MULTISPECIES: vWA domain-containing protein [unclassified Pseudomonas]QPG62747.1 VWA domain-containing protein [Pseudomonas sp. BIGb0427]UVM65151.1 VWA domain-containing protein [Pseudomonas sp. B21-009]
MSTVSVVPIIDISESMSQYGHVEQALIDTQAFLRLHKAGDKLAVVACDHKARTVFTGNGGLATVDPLLNITASAATAVAGLAFDGLSSAIGLGLQHSRSFLDASRLSRACVLLSDGQHNDGPSPLEVLPIYPVMACALGPQADQHLLQQIAQRTGGRYFYAPRAVDLMKVYNQIRASSARAALLSNQLCDIAQHGYQLIPVVIGQRPGAAQLSLVWSRREVSYTSASPRGNQLSVSLVDPSGAVSLRAPSIIGAGFVIFNIPQPAPGQWYLQVEFAGSGQSISCTAGALQHGATVRSGLADIRLSVEMAARHTAGQPLTLTAHLEAGGEVLSNVRAHAIVQGPTISLADALIKYDDQLYTVQALPFDRAQGIAEPLARLAALRHTLLPELDILAHQERVVHLGSGAGQLGTWLDTPVPGSYSVQVVVSGESQASGPFQRCELVSVLVTAD